MIEEFTPVMDDMGFRSNTLNDLQRKQIWEVGRFPMHLTDDICKELIAKDRNMLHYVSMQGGVWLITHAGVKSLLCDFKNSSGKSVALDFDQLNELR